MTLQNNFLLSLLFSMLLATQSRLHSQKKLAVNTQFNKILSNLEKANYGHECVHQFNFLAKIPVESTPLIRGSQNVISVLHINALHHQMNIAKESRMNPSYKNPAIQDINGRLGFNCETQIFNIEQYKPNGENQLEPIIERTLQEKFGKRSQFTNENLHIFIGSAKQLKRIFKVSQVKWLRHKLGFDRSGHIYLERRESFLEAVQMELHYPQNLQFTRNNLRNRHTFRIAIFGHLPFYEKSPSGKIMGVSEYILSASMAYNFTYDLIISPPNYSRLPNGSWSGVLGQLINRTLDVLFAYGRTTKLDEYVTAGTHLDYMKLYFLSGKPVPNHNNWHTAFLAPFQHTIWLFIAISFVITTLVIGLANRSGIQEGIMYTLTSLLGQGVSRTPRKMRLLFLMWIWSSILLSNHWNENLLAAISVPTVQRMPSSLTKLIESQNKIVMVNVAGTFERFLKATQIPIYVKLRERLKLTPIKSALENCLVPAALKEKCVCVCWDGFFMSRVALNLTLRSGLNVVEQSSTAIYYLSLHTTVPRGSKYFQMWNGLTGRMVSMGIAQKLTRDIKRTSEQRGTKWAKETQNYNRIYKKFQFLINEVGVQPLEVKFLRGPLWAFVFGIIAGILGLVWEKGKYFVGGLIFKTIRTILLIVRPGI